jgi:quinol monooxygenase YgiN
MITEIAYITVDAAKAAGFEAAVAQAEPAFRAAEGCHGLALERVIEEPGQYRLLVRWDSVDHHMVKFRQSDGFKLWRACAGPFFLDTPRVEHSETAVHLSL